VGLSCRLQPQTPTFFDQLAAADKTSMCANADGPRDAA